MNRSKLPNVILITLDSLRPDYLGCFSQWANEEKLSPHIDEWAVDGVVFENTISQGPRTAESFPSLLSGQYMTRYRDAFGGLSKERMLISQYLNKYGYFTVAFNSNPYISKRQNYGKGFDVFIDNLFHVAGGRLSRKILLKYLRLKALFVEPYTIAGKVNQQVYPILENVKQPYFMWVHYMDVHGPYISKKGWHLVNSVRGGKLWRKATHTPENLTPGEKEELISTYKEEVHYVDFHVGELLSKIDQDNTLIVLTADHGELLGEHGLFAHVPDTLYDPLLRVPLIIKLPAGSHIRNNRIDRPVKLLDVVPTILDIANLNHDFEFDGETLLPLIGGDPENYKCDYIISEIWTKFLSVRKGEWKLIASYEKEDKFELYNLSNDPDEYTNLSAQRQDIVAQMEDTIREHLVRINAPSEDLEKCGFEYDKAVKAQLKGLGYI